MTEPSERHVEKAIARHHEQANDLIVKAIGHNNVSFYDALWRSICLALAAAERRGAEAQRTSDLRRLFWSAASEQSLGFEDTTRVLNEIGDAIRTAPLATPGAGNESDIPHAPEPAPAAILGRFDHHPDPAIDFCVEVEAIEGLAYDVGAGLADANELRERVARAMTFCVGGDAGAVTAKTLLRQIEAGLQDPAPAADVRAAEQAALALGLNVLKHYLETGPCGNFPERAVLESGLATDLPLELTALGRQLVERGGRDG